MQGAKGTPERKRLIEALKYMQKSLSKCEKDASVSNQHRVLMYVLVSKALSDLESGESDFADCATSLYKAMGLPNPDGAGAALINSVNDINAAGYNAFADALLFDVYTMALSYYDTHMELEGQKAQTNETGYSATNTDRENIVRNKYNANGLEERTNAFDVGTGRARDFWHLSPFFRPAIGKMVEPLIDRVENNPTEWPDEDGRNDVYRTHRLAVMNSLISDQQPNMILDVSRTDRLTLAYRQGVDTDVTEGLFSKFCYKKATEYSASLPPEYVDIDFESAQSYYDILPEKPNWGSGKQQHFNFLQTIRSYAYSGRALYIEQHIGKIFPDRAKRSASIQTGGMSQYQLAMVYRAEADVCEDILFVFADAFKNSSRLKSRSFRTFCKSHPFLSQYVTKDGKIDESLFRVEVSGEMTLESQEARANALEGRCCDIIRAMEDYNLYTYRSQLYASDKKNQLCDKQIEEKVSKVLDNIKQTGAYPKFLNMFDGADDTQREAQGTTFLKAFYTVALADYYMLTPQKRKEFLLSYGVNVDPIAFFKEKGVDLNEVMTDLRIGDVSSIQQHKALLQEWVNANNGVGGAKNQLDQSNKNKQERNPNQETKPVAPKNNGNKVDESDRIQLNSLCEQMEKQYATIENTIYASGMMEWCALGAGGMVAWCALKSSVHYLEGQKIKCTQKQIKKAVNSAFKNGKLTEQGLAEALKKHAGLSDNVAKQCATHAIQEAESATQVLSRCSDTLQSNFTDDLKKVMNIADETKRMKAFKSLSKKYGLSRYDRQLLAYQVRTRNWEKAESMMPENLRIYKDRRGNMFVRGVKKTWNMSWKAFGYAVAAMVAIDLFKDDGYDAEFAKLITMAVDVGGMSQSEAEMYFSNEAYIKCRCTLDYLVENGYISETQWNKYVKVIENPNVFEPDVQYQLRKSLMQAFDIIDKVERENQTTNAVTHTDLTQILDPFNVKHSQQLETPAYQRGLDQGQSMA